MFKRMSDKRRFPLSISLSASALSPPLPERPHFRVVFHPQSDQCLYRLKKKFFGVFVQLGGRAEKGGNTLLPAGKELCKTGDLRRIHQGIQGVHKPLPFQSRKSADPSVQGSVQILGSRRQSIHIAKVPILHLPGKGIVLPDAELITPHDPEVLLLFQEHPHQRRLGQGLVKLWRDGAPLTTFQHAFQKAGAIVRVHLDNALLKGFTSLGGGVHGQIASLGVAPNPQCFAASARYSAAAFWAGTGY